MYLLNNDEADLIVGAIKVAIEDTECYLANGSPARDYEPEDLEQLVKYPQRWSDLANKLLSSKYQAPDHQRAIEIAREQHGTAYTEGSLEIDDNAIISDGGDNGAYIQAWVWADYWGTDLDKYKCSGCGRAESVCSTNPCCFVIAERAE